MLLLAAFCCVGVVGADEFPVSDYSQLKAALEQTGEHTVIVNENISATTNEIITINSEASITLTTNGDYCISWEGQANPTACTGWIVVNGGSLTIKGDAANHKLTLEGTQETSNMGAIIYVKNPSSIKNGGTLNLESGVVLKNNINKDSGNGGGGVFFNEGATVFNMADSTITNCTGYRGGGIMMKAGTLNLNEGSKILSCSADFDNKFGGGVTLNGASVSMNMNSGSLIEDCYSINGAGGIYVCGEATANLNQGAVINRCSAELSGGGVRVENAGSQIYCNGVTIQNCKTLQHGASNYGGGGISVTSGKLIVNEGTIITNCHSEGYGGGILHYGGSDSIVINGGKIYSNSAEIAGSGIAISSGGKDLVVKNSVSVDAGNDVYLTAGKKIIVESALTSTASIKAIRLPDYSDNTQVVTVTYDGGTAFDVRDNFALDPASGKTLNAIDYDDTHKLVVATDGNWNAHADTTWYNVQATEFTLTRPEQLAGLAYLVNTGTDTFEGKTVKLDANIVLNDETFTYKPDTGLVKVTDEFHTRYVGTGYCGDSSGSNTYFDTTASIPCEWYTNDENDSKGAYTGELKEWTPIGTNSNPFMGTFDGCGYAIYGLHYNLFTNYQAFIGFANNGAVIKNFVIPNYLITETTTTQLNYINLGVAVGGIRDGSKSCEISDIAVSGIAILNAPGTTGNGFGAILGVAAVADPNSVTIERCSSSNYIFGTEFERISGLVGFSNRAVLYVKNCSVFGNYHGGEKLGGIIGQHYVKENYPISIDNCIVAGEFNSGGFVGGLTGYVYSNCLAKNCVILCSEIGESAAAGRVGPSGSEEGSFSNCYAWRGMLVNGKHITGGAENNRNGADASSVDIWGNETFFKEKLDWDFINTWEMSSDANFKLPILKGMDVPNYDASYLKPVTVTFDTLGGSPVTEQKITKGFEATRPTEIPTKEGYIFEDWYKESGCKTKWGFESDIVTKDTTLYANWTAKQYKVTFDKNGGTGGISEVEATYKAAMPAISSFPKKTGYTFAGYYDAASAGTQYYNANGSSANEWDKAANATLYAHWTANTYTVTLSQTDATTEGTKSVTATYDSAMPSIPSLPTKKGYTFTGYFDTNTTSIQYYNGEGKSVRTWDKANDTTLYANWTTNTYTVHFDANGGTGTMADQTFTYDAEMALTANTFTRFGYNITGWNTNPAETTKAYNDKQLVKNLTDKGTITLYAVWTGTPYEKPVNEEHVVTFDSGLPVAKIDVGKNNGITKVKFQFKNGKPAVISTNPTGFKNTQTFGDEFDLSIIPADAQTGDVTVFFTTEKSGHYFLAHYKNNAWEFLKAELVSGTQYKAVVTKESGFSPFQIVSAEPEPSHSSSSRDYGSSIWLPATAEPTAAPTQAAEPTQAVPTVSPIQTQQPASTPAPFVGLLAGLSAAAVFFGLRRR